MQRQVASNDELHSRLFVPRPNTNPEKLSFEQRYPYNPDFVNMDADMLEVISKNYQKNVSYTDPPGHPDALKYFAEVFGVSPHDVVLAPTCSQAHWYLTALFLNDGDLVAANEGLQPDLKRVRIDSQYQIAGLSSFQEAKLVMIRNPDVDSEENKTTIQAFTENLKSTEATFQSPKAVVFEEPFALLGKLNPFPSACNAALPENTPVYLLTHLSELFLNDASSFSAIILLNNKDNRFASLTSALGSMSSFYFPPCTALHSLIGNIMQAFKPARALDHFGKLEERKQLLIGELRQQGIQVRDAPRWVFSIGVRKTAQLAALIEKGLLDLPQNEELRESDSVYLSVLHSDALFKDLVAKLTATL